MSANTLLVVSDHAADEIAELQVDLEGHLREAARISKRIATIMAMRSLIAYAEGESGTAADAAPSGKAAR